MTRSSSNQRISIAPKYLIDRRKKVYLTLDDGPHPSYFLKFLKLFDSEKVKVTFFIVGQNASKNPAMVKEAFDAGHRIGNHSFNHPDLARLNEQSIRDQIKKTEDIIGLYLGDDKILRPPYGSHNSTVDRVCRELGYRLIYWNVDTLDWNKKYQPDRWVQHGIDQMRDRSSCTVLTHDIHKSTLDNYRIFIGRIRELGKVQFASPMEL